jgi:gliding motility-associated-like protein
VKLFTNNNYLIALIFIVFSTLKLHAQLGFCNGNSGNPIFEETFGTGTVNGPELPVGTTTYNFTLGTPDDGDYTISSSTAYFDWHDTQDHTPNDIDGKSLIVNADFTAGEFYRTTVSGLCENTSYEFSSWLINLLPSSGCGGGGIPINVRFEIWDNSDTNILASGDTGNIGATATPIWQQFGLVFQTLPSQTSVILKMINNGVGGCGNDLAIDDIVFKTCGDLITITDTQNNSNLFICENEVAFSTTLTATPDFSIFATHFYQWQQSFDSINWTDIIGETNETFITPLLVNTIFYRVKVAEDAINLSNSLCNSLSEVFEIRIIPLPEAPISNGDLIICGNSTEALTVNVPNGITVNWYDQAVGGNLLLSGSSSFIPDVSNTYYAEAETIDGNCLSITRTPLQINFIEIPQVFDEELSFCENEEITLFANIDNVEYLWNTGAITSEITVDLPGIYTVEVTNIEGCSNIKTIVLTQIDEPIIESVISEGFSIIVSTSNSGNFEYSLDGISYQLSNIFSAVEGGKYTVYVRERNGCGIVTQDILHFVIPRFFTPNGDNKNDTFDLKGIEYFSTSEVFIFDRYGKLLKSSKNTAFAWDGTFNNQKLPTSDYWYIIKIDGTEFRGHFTLKR